MVAAGATIATAFVATHDPNVPGALGVCPLYAATGFYCPGCGGMRATYYLAHGDVGSALSMNPLFTLLVPLFGVLWWRWFLRTRGRMLKPWPFPTFMGFFIPFVIVAFFILRNTPMFTPYLAP